MTVPLHSALAAAVAYEGFEQLLQRKEAGRRFFDVSGPESLPNAVVDVAVFAAGHRLGELWNRTGRGDG